MRIRLAFLALMVLGATIAASPRLMAAPLSPSTGDPSPGRPQPLRTPTTLPTSGLGRPARPLLAALQWTVNTREFDINEPHGVGRSRVYLRNATRASALDYILGVAYFTQSGVPDHPRYTDTPYLRWVLRDGETYGRYGPFKLSFVEPSRGTTYLRYHVQYALRAAGNPIAVRYFRVRRCSDPQGWCLEYSATPSYEWLFLPAPGTTGSPVRREHKFALQNTLNSDYVINRTFNCLSIPNADGTPQLRSGGLAFLGSCR